MKYTIVYKEAENKYEMNGVLADFVGDHLLTISNENKLSGYGFISEGHLLSFLNHHGIKIDLLEEDGSRMVW